MPLHVASTMCSSSGGQKETQRLRHRTKISPVVFVLVWDLAAQSEGRTWAEGNLSN